MKNFVMIIVCVLFGVCGQLLLKQGMSAEGDEIDELREVLPRLARAFLDPLVLSGFLLYGISAALWLVVLTRADLSYAYPLLSMGYILVVILSRVLFREAVTPARFLGTLVICLGVYLISHTR
jgi:multidrug transporter EmrE-like cation transporter